MFVRACRLVASCWRVPKLPCRKQSRWSIYYLTLEALAPVRRRSKPACVKHLVCVCAVYASPGTGYRSQRQVWRHYTVGIVFYKCFRRLSDV